MEAMDSVKEKKRADTLVKIVGVAAKSIERAAFRQQFGKSGVLANAIERGVA